MASAIVMMIGGAVTNALAFTGGNYLFSHIGKDSDEEKKRHDKAEEKLNEATAAWNKQRILNLDFNDKERQKEIEGMNEFDSVDSSMKQYYYATGGDLEQINAPKPKPKLSDFYTPSGDQKNREIAFVVGGIVLTGFVAWKLL